jgi:hypothetical protein
MKGESQGVDKKTECGEPLLLWAVRDSNKQKFVHVGMLTPAEKGSACRCLCRSCGEPLVSINVGKPASHFDKPRTQRKHFKHRHLDSGESRCLSSVARFLALQLFVEQDAIYLPPRYRTVSRILPTGITVDAQQEIPDRLVQVKSYEWVDDVSAILRLEDGLELLVTVRAHQRIDDTGRSVCVLSLAGVCDPAIASWDSDKILQYLRLPGSGMDWESHWDDSELDAQKDGDLAEKEDLFLGGIPKKWLDNLEGKQVNETILHWLIKKTVAETGCLNVPAFSIPVRQEMPDGFIAEERAICSGGVLQLEDIRLEHRFDTMVPDVMCRARKRDSNSPEVDLLIEAAVTNYISDDKRKKIEKSGVACIQIRADLFSRTGTVYVSEIEKIICSDASVKEWIVHPWIADEVAKAKRRLADRARRIQNGIDAEAVTKRLHLEAERKRLEDRSSLKTWRNKASDLALAKGYLKVLKASWTGRPAPQLGAEPVALIDLWDELKRRKIVGSNRNSIETKGSLLSILVRIKEDAIGIKGGALIDLLVKAVSYDWMTTGNPLVIMFALKRNTPLMTPLQAETFRNYCARLETAVQNSDVRVCRLTENDRLYALLFPEIAPDLESDYGTVLHMSRLFQEHEEQKVADQRRHERRQTRVALVQRLRNEKAQRKLTKALDTELANFLGKLQWVRRLSDGPGAGVLYGRYSGQARLQGINPMDIFKTVIEYRDSKCNVDAALKAMPFKHAPDIPEAVRLLQISGLCYIPK